MPFEYLAGHSTGRHDHDEHQLVFASHGLLSVESTMSRWIVPPQRAVWVPAGVEHDVRALADSRMSTLYVDRRVAVDTLDGATVLTVSPLLRELIHHAIDESEGRGASDHVESLILDLLTAAPVAPLAVRHLRDERLRAVAEILEQDPRDDRTLRELGRAIGANERTLQRLFQRETGTTFGRWRTQLRLQHAIVLLGQGQSVTAAAVGSGYREPSAFIAAFRRTFGTTPAKYFATD